MTQQWNRIESNGLEDLVVHDEHGHARAVLRLIELLARHELLRVEAGHSRLLPQLRRRLLQLALLLLEVHAVDAARRQERRELEEELHAHIETLKYSIIRVARVHEATTQVLV